MMQNHSILQAKNLTIGYRYKVLCSELDISISRGKLVGLFGANGKGKTTLLKTLSGIIEPISGEVLINNKSIKEYTQSELSKRIAIVLTGRFFDPSLYVKDVLKIGRIPYVGLGFKLTKKDIECINEAVVDCKIEPFLERKLNTLSDGELQRVMLARAIVQETDIILLDEPTAHLDVPNRQLLFELLLHLTEKGKSIIISTHEVELAKKYIYEEINI